MPDPASPAGLAALAEAIRTLNKYEERRARRAAEDIAAAAAQVVPEVTPAPATAPAVPPAYPGGTGWDYSPELYS